MPSTDGTVTKQNPTRPRLRAVPLLGPAFVAAIAYVDPGNIAANVSAGAQYGYLLVWVLVVANAMAMVVQYLSAKLGLVLGRSLPEVLGDRMPRAGRLAFWAQAELVVIATDLAEVVGGAIALEILFGVPLPLGGLIVGGVSMWVLALQTRHGQRTFEGVVMGALAIIVIGFVAGLFVNGVDWTAAAGGLTPRFDGAQTVLLAASMLGATVMPHAIYLHSSLTRDRHGFDPDPSRIRLLLGASRWDVGIALLIAGSANIALLLLAAGNLYGVPGVDTLQGAHAAIAHSLGTTVGLVFAVGILASGLASTSVGCYAGAAVMSGLVRVRIPLLLRRAVTLVPALVILTLGFDATQALILSQVMLSIGIPFALIPLARLTSDPRLMGPFANGTALRLTTYATALAIVVLNALLVVLTLTGS
ncbi:MULTISPECIES: Nramp family divalent metal transporter [unclassified Streptomyces]|uniref:Nramp family divalent metal transporter n=1 Tax=unclassified Streptomyces TaxID=2593676 RepID=UPI0038150D96